MNRIVLGRIVLALIGFAVLGLAGCRDHSSLAGGTPVARSAAEVRVPARLTSGSAPPSSTLILGVN